MKILCISASNVIDHRNNSASTKTCELIKKIFKENYEEQTDFGIVALADYELKSCNMCAQCKDDGKCVKDEDYNKIYSSMVGCDGIFLVCPHYAPIPSKVMIILEKLEELSYISYCADKQENFKLTGKPIAIIAHGGQRKDYEECYRKGLLEPLNNAFASVAMELVGVDDSFPRGTVFGINDMVKSSEFILPEMVHDWEDVEKRIEPIVRSMIVTLQNVMK